MQNRVIESHKESGISGQVNCNTNILIPHAPNQSLMGPSQTGVKRQNTVGFCFDSISWAPQETTFFFSILLYVHPTATLGPSDSGSNLHFTVLIKLPTIRCCQMDPDTGLYMRFSTISIFVCLFFSICISLTLSLSERWIGKVCYHSH